LSTDSPYSERDIAKATNLAAFLGWSVFTVPTTIDWGLGVLPFAMVLGLPIAFGTCWILGAPIIRRLMTRSVSWHMAALGGAIISAGIVVLSVIVGRIYGYTGGGGNSFPAVARFIALAAEVRTLVGPETKISYASDWSEYFGYQPQDGSGDRYFHLDPLWADDNIDFIGIDNYMPLSDWRDGVDHLDAGFGSIYDLDYLRLNIEGGEGYDWYYHSVDAEAAQIRTAISDGAHLEPWVFRYKDIRSFGSLVHHERVGGVRSLTPTV
jgi:hypothetical protein